MPRKETYSGPISAQAQQDLVSEGIENFELPKSVVMRIAKSSIPDNVKLQKETVLSLVKGSTVFINYLAATAHDVAQSKQHKSISASDVLKALETIEFGDMVNKLQAELLVYRELSKNDKGKKPAVLANGGGAHSISKRVGIGIPGAFPMLPKGQREKITYNSVGRITPAFPPPHQLPPPQLSSSISGGMGPFTSAPLDLPTAHSPMDIDYEAEGSVSAAPPLAMGIGRPFQIGREDHGRELDGDNEGGVLAEEEVEEVEEEEEEEGVDGEDEELEDKELIEEQELRKDALGVEERSVMVQDDE
ncbi:hypothetical protein M413DRAFT_372404 [Hebeloma cylindrosporum]|uniref:DNA polymerase epsilon subunit D n=1 Tax=Hebeloma cylindrosporum TaxID=76867 RepID=A0A0C2YSG7_HEBCY|nr:hypothetical protein M413DRAFT_372404 [Hebeloma cylindrosporum h7]